MSIGCGVSWMFVGCEVVGGLIVGGLIVWGRCFLIVSFNGVVFVTLGVLEAWD